MLSTSTYRMFDDDRLPRQNERTLVEISPAQAPEAFLVVLDTILFLVNKGGEVFQLDALAFRRNAWERAVRTCQSCMKFLRR